MHSVRPDFSIEQLIYGLPDYAQESFPPYDISYAGGRPLFVTVGSFEPRKGQDIFCNAIRLLKPEVRQKAAFLFVGKAADKSLKNAVDALVEDYPDTVFYRKRLERPEIKSLMDQCACVVCASRDDPMPTFVTEGLIFGKPPSCRSTPAPPGSSPRAWTALCTKTTTRISWQRCWSMLSCIRNSWPP